MMKHALLTLLAITMTLTAAPAQERGDKKTRTVKPPEPVVGSYYFYWYRHPREHFANPDGSDGLYQHFDDPKGVSYLRPDWHREQLESMMEAGLDFVLPVYWGIPDRKVAGKQRHPFSDDGLSAMVRALEKIEAEGGEPPKVGMFFDTSTLRHSVRGEEGEGTIDLRSDEGIRIFADTILDFFSRIPDRFRFKMEDYILVTLYGSFGAPHERDLLERVAAIVEPKTASRVFWIAEQSWKVRAHASYRWGAALQGPNGDSIVQTLGPGYNDTRVPGRGTPIRDRESGRFYQWSWNKALLARPTIVLIETWNEFHEGTGIAPCKEFGDAYITMTRRAVQRLKRNLMPDIRRPVRLAHPEPLPRPDKGWWDGRRDATSVKFAASRARGSLGDGLRLARNEDGPSKREFLTERSVLSTTGSGRGWTYLYFGIADEFAHNAGHGYEVIVELVDGSGGAIGLQYDSWDRGVALEGRYKPAPSYRRGTLPTLTTLRWTLPDARFANRQNGGADFRLAAVDGNVSVTRIEVRRLEEKPTGRPRLRVE